MRTFVRRSTAVVGIIGAAAVIFASTVVVGRAASTTFTEDFSTTAKRDASTTAAWNTTTRTVTLQTQNPSWQAIGALSGQQVNSVEFSPAYAQDRTVFVGVADGIYRSADGGVVWSRVASTSQSVESIALSPAFASDHTGFAITNGNGLWRTTDGATWAKVHSASGFRVALSPAFASDRTVFAASIYRVYKSTDGGATWTSSTTGIDAEVVENGDIRGVAVSSAYASDRAVYTTTFSFGVYRSTDGGTTWSTVNPVDADVTSATAIAAGGGGRIAAALFDGVYVTTNGGSTWTRVYGGDVNNLAYVPGSNVLLLASLSGILRSQTGIAQLASGWPNREAQAVGVGPTYPASGSVIGGWASGAARITVGFFSSAIASSTVVNPSGDRITRATLTPTITTPAGTSVLFSMSVAKSADGKPVWEGPVEAGKAWTFTNVGSELRWRVTLATTDSAVTPALAGLTIAYDTVPAVVRLMSPTPGTAEPAPKKIRWKFTDTTADETGYELRDAQGRVLVTTKPDSVSNLSYLDESGLTPNTEYCGRRVVTLRNEEISPPSASYPCAVTLAETPTASAFEATSTAFALSISPGANPMDTEYVLRETTSQKYVRADRTFGGTTPAWQTMPAWGAPSFRVEGLAPNTSYTFCVVARNRAGVESPCSAAVAVRTTDVAVLRGFLTIAAHPAVSVVQPVAVGKTVDWAIEIENQGEGVAEDVAVTGIIPDGTSYVPSTLARNGAWLTDLRDGDAGDIDVTTSGAVTFLFPSLPPSGRVALTYQTMVDEDAGQMIEMRGRATYRPLRGAAPIAIDALPVRIAVRVPDDSHRLEEPEEPSEPEQPTEEPTREPESGSPEPAREPEVGGGAAASTIRITAPADGVTLDDDEVLVEGFTGIVGQTVEVLVDGVSIGGVQTNGTGSFAVTIRNLVPGQRTIVAKIVGAIASIRVVAPQPPAELVIIQPADNAATNAGSIIVSGRGPVGVRVSLAMDGAPAGEAVIDGAGNFTAAIATAVEEGRHEITARASLPNRGSVETHIAFSVDRTPPEAPTVAEIAVPKRIASSAVAGKLDTTIELHGSLSKGEFATIDALLVTVSSEPITFIFKPLSPEWTYTVVAPLEPGMHTVRVAARDLAGNVSLQPETLTFEVPPMECGDGKDNDSDGLVDYPKDPDCRSALDDRERAEGVVERAVTVVKETTTVAAKTVAAATTTAAKATAKTAERAAVVVQEQVIDNPTVQTTSERVVAPTVAIAVTANTATAVQGFQFLAYLQYIGGFFLQPWRLLTRRRRKQWGTVYDSLTKRPIDLATVRLIDAKTKKIVRSEVTDSQGRYNFIIERPGTYRIEIQRKGYAFPSNLLKGKREDAAFLDLYHGENVAVTGAVFAMNIPLDAHERSEEAGSRAIRQHYIRLVSSGVSNGGLILSFASFGITPRPFIGVILLLNIASYFFFRRLATQTKRPKSWGAVYDATLKQPIHLAVIRLFDDEYHKLLETSVTDRYGRYSFLVGKNVFDVTAQKSGYEPAKSKPIDHTKAESIIAVDIPLKPQKL